MGETLQLDRIRCDGHGLCAELLPEVIRLDDWGYPIIRAGEVPASLVEHARRAADACPVLALRLARSANGRLRPVA
jgi:ferredoxin